jgi:hypothetical protein
MNQLLKQQNQEIAEIRELVKKVNIAVIEIQNK